MLLSKLQYYSREPYYKHELDYLLVEILDTKYPLYMRYRDLEKELNLYGKISSTTLSLHLTDLRLRDVLYRRKEKNGHTFYLLTEKFKGELEIKKEKYPTSFAKETLSLPNFMRDSRIPLDWGIPADEDELF